MPRKKPTIDTLVLGQFEKDPVTSVGKYLESLKSMQNFIKDPNWDTVDSDCKLIYIEHYRQDREIKEMQKHILANVSSQEKTNRLRIGILQTQSKRLRQQFVEVNRFLRDTQEKRQIAEDKIEQQVGKQEEIKVKCRKLCTRNRALVEFREVLKESCKDYEAYETVIEDVCQKYDSFETVKDCMDRCDALMIAQQNITEMNDEKLEELEDMRSRMVTITKAASLAALGLKNTLTMLERQYDVGRHDCVRWQNVLSRGIEALRKYEGCKERVWDTVYFLYRLLGRRRGISFDLRRSQVEKSLEFIKDEVETLRDVVNTCKDKSRSKTSPGIC